MTAINGILFFIVVGGLLMSINGRLVVQQLNPILTRL